MFIQILLNALVGLAIFQAIWILFCEFKSIISNREYLHARFTGWHLPMCRLLGHKFFWGVIPRLCVISMIVFSLWLVSFVIVILPFDISGFAERREEYVRLLYLFEFARPQELEYLLELTLIFFAGFTTSFLGWIRLDLLIQAIQPYSR